MKQNMIRLAAAMLGLVLFPPLATFVQESWVCPSRNCVVGNNLSGFILLQLVLGIFLFGFLVSLDSFWKWSLILKTGFFFIVITFLIGFYAMINSYVIISEDFIQIKDVLNGRDVRMNVTEISGISVKYDRRVEWHLGCSTGIYLVTKGGEEILINAGDEKIRDYFRDIVHLPERYLNNCRGPWWLEN